MKKLITVLITALLFAFSINTEAQTTMDDSKFQLPKDSWSFGFGGIYPRLINMSVSYAGDANYGGFLSIQRDFSEHVGLKLQGSFVSLQGYYGVPEQISRTNAVTGNLDLLYYFVPCEVVSPYLTFGLGGVYYMFDNPEGNFPDDNYFTYQFNTGLGVLWVLDQEWKLRTEMNYHTVADNKFDGSDGKGGVAGNSYGGIFGGPYKSYIGLEIGLNYYFDQGEPSKLNQLYDGINIEQKDKTDYGRIEDLIKKHIPQVVEKQVVVEKPVASSDKWVLVGVNFGFNSTKLSPESYPVLLHAVSVLLNHPDVKVEIAGYTDNIGSEKYNQKLSEKRANIIKEYLVARGIAESRLSVMGYGEADPIGDNKTAAGRAMNRRIEFKVK